MDKQFAEYRSEVLMAEMARMASMSAANNSATGLLPYQHVRTEADALKAMDFKRRNPKISVFGGVFTRGRVELEQLHLSDTLGNWLKCGVFYMVLPENNFIALPHQFSSSFGLSCPHTGTNYYFRDSTERSYASDYFDKHYHIKTRLRGSIEDPIKLASALGICAMDLRNQIYATKVIENV